jgi:hypothetical protein
MILAVGGKNLPCGGRKAAQAIYFRHKKGPAAMLPALSGVLVPWRSL